MGEKMKIERTLKVFMGKQQNSKFLIYRASIEEKDIELETKF
jgi:hypothetical protein